MKITDVRTVRVNIPFAKPLRTSIHSFESAGCVLVFMDTDEGIMGESYVFSLNIPRLKVFEAMIQSYKSNVLGENPHYAEKIWQKIWQGINFFGHKGVTLFGLSAIDVACWDIKGRAAGKPLYQMMALTGSGPRLCQRGPLAFPNDRRAGEGSEGFHHPGFPVAARPTGTFLR